MLGVHKMKVLTKNWTMKLNNNMIELSNWMLKCHNCMLKCHNWMCTANNNFDRENASYFTVTVTLRPDFVLRVMKQKVPLYGLYRLSSLILFFTVFVKFLVIWLTVVTLTPGPVLSDNIHSLQTRPVLLMVRYFSNTCSVSGSVPALYNFISWRTAFCRKHLPYHCFIVCISSTDICILLCWGILGASDNMNLCSRNRVVECRVSKVECRSLSVVHTVKPDRLGAWNGIQHESFQLLLRAYNDSGFTWPLPWLRAGIFVAIYMRNTIC